MRGIYKEDDINVIVCNLMLNIILVLRINDFFGLVKKVLGLIKGILWISLLFKIYYIL